MISSSFLSKAVFVSVLLSITKLHAVPEPDSPEAAAIISAGLTAWRTPDANGISCAQCHTPFGYDIALFNFNRADVRLATTPHLSEAEADAIFDMLEVFRSKYPPAGGLRDFRTFRPLQPGGGVIVGGETSSADVRDAAFGFQLQDQFKLARDPVRTLAQARAAAQELVDVHVADVPIGIKFNLWSRSALREGAVHGGEVAEWLPSTGLIAKPAYAAQWLALQDAYIADPSTPNMWALYQASSLMVDLDPHNFVAGQTHGNWKWIILGQHRANLVMAHDELLKARGLPSLLADEDGVRPFRSVRSTVTADLAAFWSLGDNARVIQLRPFAEIPRRNRETMWLGTNPNMNDAQTWGDQIRDLRLPWFWMGWMMDNSLRFSGEGSTLSGEYFIGSLWEGEAGENTTHGYRMHQVFFNAVHQYKLAFKQGAWRENDGTQRFNSRKDYYLGYNRWRQRDESVEIGQPGANALYRKMLSNHQRMNVLIHNDELRRSGISHLTATDKSLLIADIELWRTVLRWSDRQWASADGALLDTFKSTIQGTVRSLPPFISSANSAFAGTHRVTLTPMSATAQLRYTTDGTMPTATSGMLYTGPISVSTGGTLRAIAIEDGLPESLDVRADFTPESLGVRLFATTTSATELITAGSERGLRFQVDTPGVITALHYYRTANETGSHTGRLWLAQGATGNLLASVPFTTANDAPGAGWRVQPLAAPIMLTPGLTYVISLNANSHYPAMPNIFDVAQKVGPLTALRGNNGVYGNTGSYPQQSSSNSNYLRDVSFVPVTDHEAWRVANFATAYSAGAADDVADPDGDGVQNLIEYAINTLPLTAANTAPTRHAVNASGLLTLTFLRARADVDYIVEGSSDLRAWEILATNPGSVGSEVTVVDSPPTGNERRFMRLRVLPD